MSTIVSLTHPCSHPRSRVPVLSLSLSPVTHAHAHTGTHTHAHTHTHTHTLGWSQHLIMFSTIRTSSAVPRGAPSTITQCEEYSPFTPDVVWKIFAPPPRTVFLHTHLVRVGISWCVFDSPTPRVLSFYTRTWPESAFHGVLFTIRRSAAVPTGALLQLPH